MEELECSKHAENIINQKIEIFYMEAIPHFFSQLPQNVDFCSLWKYFSGILENVGFY